MSVCGNEHSLGVEMSLSAKVKAAYLFVLPWSLDSIGGINQVVENLMNQLERHGDYIPLLMVNSWKDTKVRRRKIKGCIHHFFRLRSPWNNRRPLINLLVFCASLGWNLLNLIRFIRTNKIDVINVHFCGLYALNISIAKKLRLFRGEFILSFHGRDLLAARQTRGLEKRLWKILLRSADTIVTCSESLKNDLILFDAHCLDRVVVIHNGIDISFLEQERDRSYRFDPALEGGELILNVATFQHIKGQDVLVKAFANVAKLFPNVHLVIIGRPGEALEQLRILIRSFGLAHCVRLYEGMPHDIISAFLEKATIFALPSRYESFGIVILEAGAFGVPVVATSVGGVSEILSHDQTGKLCEPEDSECLARELAYLLKRPEERERLGNNLRKHVLENFSWEHAYQKYVECVRA